MELGDIIFALIIILFILLIIYMIKDTPKTWNIMTPDFWLSHFVENPKRVYNRSHGYFDHPAQMALDRARQKDTAGSHALAGTIIARNIIEPQLTQRNDQPVAMDNVTLQTYYNEILDHYTIALIEHTIPNNTPQIGERPRTRITPYINTYQGIMDYDQQHQLIVNDIIDFTNTIMLITALMANPVIDFGNITALHDMASARQDELINERRAASLAKTKSLAAATVDYVISTEIHRDDPQNVHDPGVLAHAKGILDRIKAELGETAIVTKYAIKDEFMLSADKYSNSRPLIFDETMMVLSKLSTENKIVKLDTTDEECLCLIWTRATTLDNKDMKQAIFDNLYDCWENGYSGREIVCATGRVLRILAALTTLDPDKRNWEITLLDEHKNEIMKIVGAKIINVAMQEKNNNDAEIKKAAYRYLAETKEQLDAVGQVSDDGEKALQDKMREEVIATIDSYLKSLVDKGMAPLTSYYVDMIKKDAVAAIM
jgi:hypothetical protein